MCVYTPTTTQHRSVNARQAAAAHTPQPLEVKRHRILPEKAFEKCLWARALEDGGDGRPMGERGLSFHERHTRLAASGQQDPYHRRHNLVCEQTDNSAPVTRTVFSQP